MAQNSASPGPGLFDQGRVWDEEIGFGAFAGFDTPRRRITGATAKPVSARAKAASVDAQVPSYQAPVRGTGVPGRRTVTIRGYGAERNLAPAQSRRRRSEPRHQRSGFQADRAAMWAVLLGIVLVVVAAASARGAVFSPAQLAASHRSAPHVASLQAHPAVRAELRITARR